MLASNENGEHEKAEERLNEVNLYEWHAGADVPVTFIAKLDKASDKSDWEGFTNDEPGSPDKGYKASRVSSDGTKVLISSVAKLTSYDNAGKNEAYLYDAIEPSLGHQSPLRDLQPGERHGEPGCLPLGERMSPLPTRHSAHL